jgi:hypothetical protein
MSLASSLRTSSSGRRAARLACALLLALVSCAAAAAMPLDEYRSRLRQASLALDELWETEASGEAEYAERMRSAFAKVVQSVPKDEVVEWEGGSARVNNHWLEDEARAFEKLSGGDERTRLLSRVAQRLSALEERAEELGGGRAAADAAAKAQEKARMEAILRRKEFDETPPEKSWLERVWEQIKRWWNGLFNRGGSLMPGQTSWLSVIVMVVIFLLAGGLLGYAVWKFLPYFARRREERLKREKAGPRVILGEQLEPGQTAADILAAAEELARRGELRAAIRKGYVALLCELGDRKVLTLAQSKTNHDYLRAVREKRPLLKEMQKLTASFENHWYGFAPATPDDWTAFRSGYQQTLKTAALLSEK